MRKTVLLSTNTDVECLNYMIQAQEAEKSLKALASEIFDITQTPEAVQCHECLGHAWSGGTSDDDIPVRCFACQGTGLFPVPMSEL